VAFAGESTTYTESFFPVAMTNIIVVLALRPLRLSLRRPRSLDPLRTPDIPRTSTPALLHHAVFSLSTNHYLARSSAKLAITSDLLPRLYHRLQCAHARCCASLFAHRCFRRRGRGVDSSGLLVLLLDTGGPWWS
jgi:hypothetical protein